MKQYPKISIVTPNYNYGHLLEETILSVLDQNYPELEYIIIDGGSTDNSIEIIKKYESYLTFWSSEKDGGVYDALNTGFSKCTGDIMAYLNSDDLYLPWSFDTIASVFSTLPEIEWLSTLQPGYVDFSTDARWFGSIPGFSKDAFKQGYYSGKYSKYMFIQQESTFWKRSLWEKVNAGIDTEYKLAGDFYLWNEFYKHTDLIGLNNPLALFRSNEAQKSGAIDTYIAECISILSADGVTDINHGLGEKIVKTLFRKNNKSSFTGQKITKAFPGSPDARWMIDKQLFSL